MFALDSSHLTACLNEYSMNRNHSRSLRLCQACQGKSKPKNKGHCPFISFAPLALARAGMCATACCSQDVQALLRTYLSNIPAVVME